MRIAVPEVQSLIRSLLEQAGVPPSHALLQCENFLEAELRGHPSHGLQRLPRLLSRIERGLADPEARGRQIWSGSAFLSVDGGRGLGPVVGLAAVETMLSRINEAGIAVAAIRNANHLGMLAPYVEKIAAAGAAGVALSSSEALVHPFGGTQPMLGTNPIAIAMPSGKNSFVLDLATGTVSMGKIHDYARRGIPLPKGWALDRDGAPATDAEAAKTGAITPFGGAKGYGLGLGLELLVAALAGSAFAPDIRGTLDDEHVANKGDVLIAIRPGVPGVAAAIEAYLESIRQSRGASTVRVPGDGARRRRQRAIEQGIDIDPMLWGQLAEMQRRGCRVDNMGTSDHELL